MAGIQFGGFASGSTNGCGCCECNVTFCCGNNSGCTVSVYSSEGGMLLASGVTGSNGCVTLTWAGIPGSFYVTLSGGSCPAYAGTRSVACNQTIQLCGGVILCGDCSIPTNLILTDANGSIPFVYDTFNQLWLGNYSVSVPNVIVGGGAECGDVYDVGTGDVGISYSGGCVEISPGVYGFSVSQAFSFNLVQVTDDTPYFCGEFSPITCEFSCPEIGPCAVAGPVQYYTFSGVVGGSVYYLIPASSWSSCSPFAWSGTIPSSISGSTCGTITIPALVTPVPGTITVTSA